MTEFLRVRDDRTGHEYDAPVASLEAAPHPHLTVIDKVPVTEQRPPKHAVAKSSKFVDPEDAPEARSK